MRAKNILREQIESLIIVHKLANWDKNLGQYKSEYKCQCGFTFIVDGHNPSEVGVRRRMDKHVTDNLLALLQAEIDKCLPEKIDLLDTGSLHGPDGTAGIEAPNAVYVMAYNQALTDIRHRLREFMQPKTEGEANDE